MPLTNLAAKAAKPREKPYKLFDAKGLYLLIHPGGGRYWRFKFRLQRREKLLALPSRPSRTNGSRCRARPSLPTSWTCCARDWIAT